MKTFALKYSFLLLLMAMMNIVSGQKGMIYVLDVYNFSDIDGTPYIESHLSINASSIRYQKNENGNFQGSVDITFLVTPKEANAKPIFQKAYQLMSPELTDTSKDKTNFLITDVYRIPLKPGEFTFSGSFIDNLDPSKAENKFETGLEIEDDREKFHFSDIQFIKSIKRASESTPYTKHGFDIIPQNTNNYFADQDTLSIYLELYNVNKLVDDTYFIHTNIMQANSDTKLQKYVSTSKRTLREHDAYTVSFDIRDLPGQTYYLNVEIYNKKNQVVAKTSEKFWVTNNRLAASYTADLDAYERLFGLSEKELDYYIPTMAYISTNAELSFVKTLKTFDDKKNYFMSFWGKRRMQNDLDPSVPWIEYKKKVAYMNDHFCSSWKDGWQTEMGRVLAMYGPPSDIEKHPGSMDGLIPYELWRYDRIGNESNLMFVFNMREIGTCEYFLLHSNKFGENSNPKWKQILAGKVMDQDNPDDTGIDPFTDFQFQEKRMNDR